MDSDATLVQDATQIEQAIELSRHVEPPPTSVPGYDIERRLGEGAYGAVWLAREQNTGKQVAIKFYTHRRGLDWSLLNREVEKLAVLYTSRNIVRLLSVGWDHDPPYYVMEHLENGSLNSFLAKGPLPVHEAVRIAESVLHALVHAHGSGILHCDLKPANVLLDADFEPRLCDFGQSRLSDEQNPALGTLFYMAPEQADLKAVPDARWDVYALGALLYHMICGEPPYRTPENERLIESGRSLDERLATYRRIVKQNPKPMKHRSVPGVDRRLSEIVERCLNVDPQKRYPNAQAVLDRLQWRDRQRARRPLLMLGIFGPGLLLLAMAYSLYHIMLTAEHDAGQLLSRRAVESDVLPANILARNVARDLTNRRIELIETAEMLSRDPDLPAKLDSAAGKSAEERDVIFSELLARRTRADANRAELHLQPDESWMVKDANGYQRWRSPYKENTSDGLYNWRDYFHGLGKDWPEGQPPPNVQPIREPHISVPFLSQATNQYMIAITVPVWDTKHEKVVAVLGRTTHLGNLMEDYGQGIRGNERGDIQRVLALVDFHEGTLLDHPWLTPQRVKELGKDVVSRLKISEEVIKKLQSLQSHAGDQGALEVDQYIDSYVDPVVHVKGEESEYGGEWLAAFALIGDTKWAAIVQERRGAALRPVEEMKQGLVQYGFWALLASCALIGLLWYFVGRALDDRAPRFWTARGNGSQGGTPSTSPTAR